MLILELKMLTHVLIYLNLFYSHSKRHRTLQPELFCIEHPKLSRLMIETQLLPKAKTC